MIDLILRGGRVASSSGESAADVAVDNGVIVGIGHPREMPTARRVIDVAGADVLPGVIDAHVHFAAYGARGDSFQVAAQSAAHGLVTTMVSFLLLPGEVPLDEAIDHCIGEAGQTSPIDFAYHLVLLPKKEIRHDVDVALTRGITSFKLFTTYRSRGLMVDDGMLLHVMQHIATSHGIAMLHAENNAIIEWLEEQSRGAGRVAPIDYPATRPPVAEIEAIKRVITLAATADCSLYIVHVSTAGGLLEVKQAKEQGYRVYAETCPQYLLLDASLMSKVGALAKIAPPLRTVQDQEALWEGLRNGDLDVVASDHSPHTRNAKASGRYDIFQAPYGAPGTETLVPLLYSEGVLRRGLTLTWLTRVLSGNPARIFGLYPRKGAIAVGSDADFAVLDPHCSKSITATEFHTTSDFTLFEGFELLGDPVLSILRGEVVMEGGSLQVAPGYGRYLSRNTGRSEIRGRVG